MRYVTNQTGCLNIKEPPLEPPDPVILGLCAKCGGELYQGEHTVLEDGKRMCLDCFARRVNSLLRISPAIVADCLGMRYEEAR